MWAWVPVTSPRDASTATNFNQRQEFDAATNTAHGQLQPHFAFDKPFEHGTQSSALAMVWLTSTLREPARTCTPERAWVSGDDSFLAHDHGERQRMGAQGITVLTFSER